MLQAYKEGNLTGEKMREAAISWKDVFDEIPINVHSSPLATALLHTVEPNTIADGRDFARLDLSVGPLLEKNLEFLNDCLDDVVAEQQKVCLPHTTCVQPSAAAVRSCLAYGLRRLSAVAM